jgi:UrcA family protein
MRSITITLLALGGAALAAPAFAQTVDELVITGPNRGDQPDAISRTVSFADLDLTYAGDRAELRHRVNVVARQLCDELGESSPSPIALGHSCQDNAVRGAEVQVREAIDAAFDARNYAANDYYPPR